MNLEDVEKLLAIIDDSHFTEIDLTVGDVHLSARKGGASPVGPDSVPARMATSGPNAPTAPVPGDGVTAVPTGGGPGTTTVIAEVGPADADEDLPDKDCVVVRAPVVGVFFRAPSPGAAPFAEQGQEVAADQTIGSIEVMKLFSSVAAGTSGTLVRFLVENADLVEYDQPLALIRPHAS